MLRTVSCSLQMSCALISSPQLRRSAERLHHEYRPPQSPCPSGSRPSVPIPHQADGAQYPIPSPAPGAPRPFQCLPAATLIATVMVAARCVTSVSRMVRAPMVRRRQREMAVSDICRARRMTLKSVSISHPTALFPPFLFSIPMRHAQRAQRRCSQRIPHGSVMAGCSNVSDAVLILGPAAH